MSTITESIGRVLADRYRIEAALGSGASANVFAAFDISLQRRVAIKVLHPALAADAAFLRRFRSEAQAAAALAHAHILAVHDWGEDARGPFLVLEFLGGGSLRDMLDEDRRLSLAQAVGVGIQAADGLAFAHSRGFVHRDVKPANLLFDTEGRLRVADFGLARALAEAALTEPAGATVGTARYAAPEQALGHRVDGRADVYALALVLYEAVTGVVPFTADTTISTLMARVGARLPGHDGLGPLAELLDAAAEPEPEDRLDASQLGARLRELASELPEPDRLPLAGPGGGGVVLPRKSTASPGPAADLTEHGMQAPPPPSPRRLGRGGDDPDVLAFAAAVGLTHEAAAARRRRKRWPWVAAIVVVAAALAVTGVAFALHTTKLLVPSHRLPVVTGLTTDEANAKLHRDHLHVAVVNQRASITAPKGVILREIPGAGTRMKEGSIVQVVLSSGPPPVSVPVLSTVTNDCPGVTAALAQAHLTANCSYQNSTTVAKGSVIDWNPKGTAIYGTSVSAIISSGPPIVTIPSLSGSTCSGATATLQALNLAANCTQDWSSTVPNGQVIDWNPKGNAPYGTTINIVVSKGPQPVVIPPIKGKTVSDAIALLQAVGLNPVSGGGSLSGHVFLSDPPEGQSVPPGTTVTLYSR